MDWLIYGHTADRSAVPMLRICVIAVTEHHLEYPVGPERPLRNGVAAPRLTARAGCSFWYSSVWRVAA